MVMKRSILLAIFLLAAILAYPQTRRTRTDSQENTKQETPSRQSGNSNARTAPQRETVQPSRQVEKKKEATRERTAAPVQQRQESAERAKPANTTPSSQARERVEPQRQSNGATQQTRSRVESSYENRTTSSETQTNRETGRRTRPSSTSERSSVRDNNAVRTNPRNEPTRVVRVDKDHPVKSPIVIRETRVVHHNHVYHPIEYRRVHYHYRAPVHVNIVWTNRIYHDFIALYPHHHYYINLNFSKGRSIETISAYDAMYYIGNVMRVYGEVSEVYYSSRDDMWYLYIGAPYPYHDFTVMIAGKDYRRYRFPHLERLEGAHIWSMGLITEFDGKPEILIRKPYQLGVY